VPSCILQPLWNQLQALAPVRNGAPPGGRPPSRVPDRVIFDKLIQVLVFGCGYRRIAGASCSATTLRRRRDEWIALGLAEQLHQLALAAYDRLHGLEPEHLAIDGCITKAPGGGQVAGPSPVDRRSRASSAWLPARQPASRWQPFRPRPTAATMSCWRRP